MAGSRKGGFTLVEVLIAMTLVSVIVLVMTLALRLALSVWQRGSEQEESLPLLLAIPTVLDRQLLSLVPKASFGAEGGEALLPFCGEPYGFSFFTGYAPQGSRAKGLLRVTCVYDEASEALLLYQQIVTRREHIDDRYHPLGDLWEGELEPVSTIRGVRGFDLRFSDQDPVDLDASDDWEDRWSCETPGNVPSVVRVRFQLDEKGGKVRTWYFLTRTSDL